jgi:glyoxylase-like metal-dependent hydrolase (beta-lactamase superfamily II)
MREIVAGVFGWDWFAEKFGYDFHGWLVPHEEGNLVVDPVTIPDGVLAALKERGVRSIVITNRNHYRDAERLRVATGATVRVHPADAAFVRAKGVQADGALEAGGRIGPFTVEAAAGKSPGEVALHWRERKLLIVGDACVGPRPGELGLLPPAVIDDLAGLRRSLERLAGLEVESILCCDGHPVLSGGRAALERLCATWR